MSIEMQQPDAGDLPEVDAALADWQQEGTPFQLHPGDVGWAQVSGADAVAAALRVWSRDGRIVAIGLVDGPVLRLTVPPDLRTDDALAQHLAADLTGRLAEASVELPGDAVARDVLAAAGWTAGEAWTPLRRDLAAPVEDPGLEVQLVGPDEIDERVAVHRASFERSTFTRPRWIAMAASPAYARARCLIARDGAGRAVAAVTVWSAGAGRPGLIEPLGAHRDFRGHGHGRAVTLAAARLLADLGASSAVVATPSSNTGGVRTYVAAGFEPAEPRLDLNRPA